MRSTTSLEMCTEHLVSTLERFVPLMHNGERFVLKFGDKYMTLSLGKYELRMKMVLTTDSTVHGCRVRCPSTSVARSRLQLDTLCIYRLYFIVKSAGCTLKSQLDCSPFTVTQRRVCDKLRWFPLTRVT